MKFSLIKIACMFIGFYLSKVGVQISEICAYVYRWYWLFWN